LRDLVEAVLLAPPEDVVARELLLVAHAQQHVDADAEALRDLAGRDHLGDVG